MNDNTEEQRATTVIEIKLRACRRGLGCWRWEVGGDGRVRGAGTPGQEQPVQSPGGGEWAGRDRRTGGETHTHLGPGAC